MDREASHSRSRAEEASTEAAAGDDLISRLPDCILGEIVTRLPTADAVRVQVLSSRWRHAWCSSPPNLDLGDDDMYYSGRYHYHCYSHLVSGILAAHPGPGRRLRLAGTSSGDDNAMRYDRWLCSAALNGLQDLEIDLGHSSFAWNKNALPERALRFAPTLRVLRIGNHAFPSGAGAAAALVRFPDLELVSLVSVDISEAALHGVLAGCPVLRTLVLDSCTGFAGVRINSPTITSFAVSAYHGCTAKPEVTLRQVIIEDAPLLEKLIPFRHWVTDDSFELRVVRGPRVRVLGGLSTMISKFQFGATVFKVASRRVNLVTRDNVVREKRSLMQAVVLSATLQTVKILALEDVDCVDDVSNFLRCFPCLEKLYLTVSERFRSAGSYDKLNPIECIEGHLKMVAINEYEGKRSHLKLAKFFVRNAWVLELVTFIRSCRSYYNPSETEEWIADQRRQLRVWNMASHHVKFHFVSGTGNWGVNNFGKHVNDLSAHIHDSSRDDPFHQWFES